MVESPFRTSCPTQYSHFKFALDPALEKHSRNRSGIIGRKMRYNQIDWISGLGSEFGRVGL